MPASVVAYGRVVPGERSMAITLPFFQGGPQVVAKLTVKVGDWVAAGQVLAQSANYDVAAASLAQAEAREAAVGARLEVVREGAKPEDIAAQAALVASEEYDARQARQQFGRSSVLHRHDDVPAAQWKDDAARLGSLENKLAASRHTLQSMRHPRPEDIAAAEADLADAKAAVAFARASLALTELRAPFAGRILKIVSYPGEQVGDRGVLLFGATDDMQIKAEIDISDVAHVHVGASVEATAPAWTGAITGKVVRIAPRVDHSAIVPPSTFTSVDRRVVDVTVRLDHPKIVQGLSGAEATVTIAASP